MAWSSSRRPPFFVLAVDGESLRL